MQTHKLKYFKNDGFGWACIKCSKPQPCGDEIDDKSHSRLLFEGEAESKEPRFSSIGLAKWLDPERETLICPNCDRKEKLPK